jgi:hypothetical protein
LAAIWQCPIRRALSILFGQEGNDIPQPPVLPAAPATRDNSRASIPKVLFQLLGVPLQIDQIVEWVDTIQLAGMYQTHEQIADSGGVQRLIKECVLAVQNDPVSMPVGLKNMMVDDFSGLSGLTIAAHGDARERDLWPDVAGPLSNYETF